jgi:RNA polymerase sigma-70 factor (ECF subfamily)
LNHGAPPVVDAALAADEWLRARAGDRSAFAALVHRHRNGVFSLALRMLGSRASADDLAQEVFIQLHSHLPTLESAEHLLFWLRRVTTHRAIDQLRRRTRLALAPLDDAADLAGEPDTGDPLLQRRLRQLLLDLKPDARAVMILRFQEDLDPVEIAGVLEMPVNTVKSHLKRSLDTLRSTLTGAPPVEDIP